MNVCVLAITKGTLNSVMGEASGYSGQLRVWPVTRSGVELGVRDA